MSTPAGLEAIREEFLAVEPRDRLLLLLEFADDLPPLPERYGDAPELLERVPECQAPVFVKAEVADDGVHVHATAPAEAPTTRGFASVLAHGLEGLSREEALAVPDDFPDTLGLTAAVSPLRLRGMSGMLARIKRQLREA
ncbi:SufE family protein [Amnibacterium setariae]|uniref:SufE family protein n=1 Tax=Amnibacterium setariae TaxID=2306585 RepID=A0A3A1TZH0_9MICO|nr:SufE family protein [Amnibacterium setariae]RIX28065.1 SufE family protein [Amnibacterium setariae]